MRHSVCAWVLLAAISLAAEAPTAEEAVRLARAGDLENALKAFDAIVAQSPKDAHARQQRALVCYAIGEFDWAIGELDGAIELEPAAIQSWRLRGAAKLRAGRHVEAVSDFNHALEMSPGDGASYAGRMAARLGAGDEAGGLGDYKAATAAAGEAEAFRRLLSARVGALPKLVEGDDLARAERLVSGDLDAVFPVLPDLDGAENLLAEIEAKAKADGNASLRVRSAVLLGKALEHPHALNGLDPEKQQDRIREARAAYLRAIEADGKNQDGYLAWAESFLVAHRQNEQGRDPFKGALDYLDEAQELLESALEECGEGATLHRLLGSVLEARVGPDAAAAEYEKAIALAPKDRLAYAALAGLRLRRENSPEKALVEIDREIQACGDDDETLLSRAFCLARLGKKDEAAGILRFILHRVALTHPISADGDLAQLMRETGLLPAK
ncbi:MAG: hypothetical protein AAB434_03570 [Planctomycetota bacterium]